MPASFQLAELWVSLTGRGDLAETLNRTRAQVANLQAAASGLGPTFRTFFMENVGLSRQMEEALRRQIKLQEQLSTTGPAQRGLATHIALGHEQGVAASAANLRESKARQAYLSSAPGQQGMATQLVSETQIAALMKAQTLQQAQLKVQYQGTEEGKKALAVQAQMDKQLKALGETDAWQKQVAQQGLVGASLSKLKDKMVDFQGTATAGFVGLTASVMGFTAAASPEAMGTFTGSLQLVSAELGSAFIPYAMQASLWLQQLSDDIRDMDPETKNAIASWTMYAVAIGGTLMVLPRVLTLLGPLSGAYRLVNGALVMLTGSMTATAPAAAGMNMALLSSTTAATAGTAAYTALGTALKGAAVSMKAFMLANPLTVVIGLGAAIYGLVRAFQSTSEAIDSVMDRMGQMRDVEQRLEGGGRLNRADYVQALPLEVRQRLERQGTTQAQQREIIRQMQQEYAESFDPAAAMENVERRLREDLGHNAAERQRAAVSAAGLGQLRTNAAGQNMPSPEQQAFLSRLPDLSGGRLTEDQIRTTMERVRERAEALNRQLHAMHLAGHDVLEHGVPAGGPGRRTRPTVRRPQAEGSTFSSDLTSPWRTMQQAAFNDPLLQEQRANQIREYESRVANTAALDRNTAAQQQANQAQPSQDDINNWAGIMGWE